MLANNSAKLENKKDLLVNNLEMSANRKAKLENNLK